MTKKADKNEKIGNNEADRGKELQAKAKTVPSL